MADWSEKVFILFSECTAVKCELRTLIGAAHKLDIDIWFHSLLEYRLVCLDRLAQLWMCSVFPGRRHRIQTMLWCRWNRCDDTNPMPLLLCIHCNRHRSIYFQRLHPNRCHWVVSWRRPMIWKPRHPMDSHSTQICSTAQHLAGLEVVVFSPGCQCMSIDPLSHSFVWTNLQFLLSWCWSISTRFWNGKTQELRFFARCRNGGLPYFRCHGKFPLNPIPRFSQAATIKLNFRRTIMFELWKRQNNN